MGSPPTGLPALVKRRRENRVTGVQSRTDRWSLETMGPNATGSHQTDRGDVTQRSKNGREKKYSRGLDNSGNIEGKIQPLCTPSRPLLPLVPAPRPPALAHAWPARGPPRLPPAAGPRWWPPAGPFPPPAASTLSLTPRHLQCPQRAGAAAAAPWPSPHRRTAAGPAG